MVAIKFARENDSANERIQHFNRDYSVKAAMKMKADKFLNVY